MAEIVLMGGGYFEGGNITPAAEFNIYVDPEAADIVFRAGIPLTVMPLDVTHKALTSRAWVEEGMRSLGTPVAKGGRQLDRLLRTLRHRHIWVRRRPPARPLRHRLPAAARVFHGRHVNVMIETKGEFTLGATVADWWRVSGREPNAMFHGRGGREGFFGLLTERVGGCEGDVVLRASSAVGALSDDHRQDYLLHKRHPAAAKRTAIWSDMH